MPVVGNWLPTGGDQERLTHLQQTAILRLAQAADAFAKIKNIQAQMKAGGSDYTTIETYFSLPTGSGQAISDLIGTAADALAGPGIQGVLQRLA